MTMAAPLRAQPAEPPTLRQVHSSDAPMDHLADVQMAATIRTPHRWGVDFVKRGDYLYVTGSESQRKFLVVDAHDPASLRVVAETEGGMYAARNLCLFDDFALINCYRWINPIDIRRPERPRLAFGCLWKPDDDADNVPQHYRFACRERWLYLACGDPRRALRTYEIQRDFLPRQIGAVDLSDRIGGESVAIMRRRHNWYPNAEIILDGERLFTSYGTHLAAFDIREPAAPRVLFCHDLHVNVVGLALRGQTLFVTMNNRWRGRGANPAKQAALLVLDVSDAAAPRPVGLYRDMEVPERMLIDGARLYLIGEERTPGDALHIDGVPMPPALRARHGRRTALHVLDVSDAARPRCVGRLAFPFSSGLFDDAVCRAMALDDGVLFAADQDFGIRTIDVRDAARPRFVGGLRTVSHEVRGMIPREEEIIIANMPCLLTAAIDKSIYNVANMPGDPAASQAALVDAPSDAESGTESVVSLRTAETNPSLAALGRWDVSFPQPGPNPRYLYGLPREARDIVILDFAAGGVAGFVPLPAGWGGRDLGWSRGRLYVLAVRGSDACVLVYEPIDDGRGLNPLRRIDFGRPAAGIGWGWGATFVVADDRLFVLQSVRGEAGRDAGESQRPPATHGLHLYAVDVSQPDQPRVLPRVDLLEAGGEIRPTYENGRGLAWTGGHLYLHAIDETARRRRASYLLAYDLGEAGRARLVGSLRAPTEPVESWVTRNLCALSPHPYLLCTAEQGGAWIADVRDPRQPRVAWREALFPRGTDTESYDGIAKPAPAWRDGVAFVPRLDRVDLFRVAFFDGPPPTIDERRGRIEALAAALRAEEAAELSAAQRAARRVAGRAVRFYLDAGDLQQAEAAAGLAARVPREVSARAARAEGAIQIDGRDDEWRNATPIHFAEGPATIRWQWDERALYGLLSVVDPLIERDSGPPATPHAHPGDHVDLFFTPLPAAAERGYGPADLHLSIDLAGRVALHHQNPRVRGGAPEHRFTPARSARAAVARSAEGYVLEFAIPHDDTWIEPIAGARIAASVFVVDRGARPMRLSAGELVGYRAVQPDWPVLELSP